MWDQGLGKSINIEGLLPKRPYLPWGSMAGRALLAGYHRFVSMYTLLNKYANIYQDIRRNQIRKQARQTKIKQHTPTPKVIQPFVLYLYDSSTSWWRYQMEIYSTLLALCRGNPLVTSVFSPQRPVTPIYDVFFDMRLNKRLNTPSRRRQFDIWNAIALIMTSL